MKKKTTSLLKDGGANRAADAHEFVTALREGSKFDSGGTNAEYMMRFAQRYKIQTGLDLNASSEGDFLDGLKNFGYATHIRD
jgi:hypothetical protein